ncbi:hypothetical protein CALVIDRAFT_543339 [Calocera viscosa TUFC12733]|uniref:Uncharacterized protein n=1 Tax=Calocera viscosa (strain TUFC12733) TaxID=1330018 RepID=A0A167FQE6_CALVF|nr:hypothetical protein CALVIDRAFT_543339 [Calocera viscosa TUFC12733]
MRLSECRILLSSSSPLCTCVTSSPFRPPSLIRPPDTSITPTMTRRGTSPIPVHRLGMPAAGGAAVCCSDAFPVVHLVHLAYRCIPCSPSLARAIPAQEAAAGLSPPSPPLPTSSCSTISLLLVRALT